MTINPFNEKVNAANLPLEKLATNPALSQGEKVKELSRQFEAVLLRQVLSQAQKTQFPSSMNSSGATNSIYQDLVTEQMADCISKGGTLGFAQSFSKQLSVQLKTTDAATASTNELPAPHSPEKS